MKLIRTMKTMLALLLTILFVAIFATGLYHVLKPLPEGLSHAGSPRLVHDAWFLSDVAYLDRQGVMRTEHQILNQAITLIDNARQFLLLDMSFQTGSGHAASTLNPELVAALIKRKTALPDLQAIVITNPANTDAERSTQLQGLASAGVELIYTDLDKLRDSNPVYSAFWRTLLNPSGNSMSGQLRSSLRQLNFKSNHRNLVIADNGAGHDAELLAMVGSAHPHDGKTHCNVALVFTGPAVLDLVETEQAVMRLSTGNGFVLPSRLGRLTPPEQPRADQIKATMAVLTEGAIKDALLKEVRQMREGHSLYIAMLYLSHSSVVRQLALAGKRGADVRVVLDTNLDAPQHSGLPNTQTARQLHNAGVALRWCDSTGQSCQSKMALAIYPSGQSVLLMGSANFTRRSLDGYNLETDVMFRAHKSHDVIKDAGDFFQMSWHNQGRTISAPYESFADDSLLKAMLYRITEATGACAY